MEQIFVSSVGAGTLPSVCPHNSFPVANNWKWNSNS